MKIVSYIYNNELLFGHLYEDQTIIDLHKFSKKEFNANNIIDFISQQLFNDKLVNDYIYKKINVISIKDVKVVSPIPFPRSIRDAYAFKQHVEAGRRSRGLDMIPEYDDFPVYYYSNHQCVFGPGKIKLDSIFLNELDFELEIAAVIGKEGYNIDKNIADEYIAGFMIMNDWSCRSIQKKEMKLNLGPAKGKDFATSFGPYLVTADELKKNVISKKNGNRYNLKMSCSVNGVNYSNDNFKNITWTFSEIIEQVSKGTKIFPGDIIGSGTCATGCFLELNHSLDKEIWLKENDEVKITIEKLGTLTNTIILN